MEGSGIRWTGTRSSPAGRAVCPYTPHSDRWAAEESRNWWTAPARWPDGSQIACANAGSDTISLLDLDGNVTGRLWARRKPSDLLQAVGVGLVMTSLIGPFMVVRSWGPNGGVASSVPELRDSLAPLIGELPRIVGTEPFLAFPSALLLMTFLSFFIGVFLQLMWEELPITEPL